MSRGFCFTFQVSCFRFDPVNVPGFIPYSRSSGCHCERPAGAWQSQGAKRPTCHVIARRATTEAVSAYRDCFTSQPVRNDKRTAHAPHLPLTVSPRPRVCSCPPTRPCSQAPPRSNRPSSPPHDLRTPFSARPGPCQKRIRSPGSGIWRKGMR